MSKVITFSRTFPSYHPKAGQPTYFVEKVLKSLDAIGVHPFEIPLEVSLEQYQLCGPKHHTIRAGHRFKVGDWFSPRVWSGRPYNSKQIQFAPEIQVKKVFDFCVDLLSGEYTMAGLPIYVHVFKEIAKNDGLTARDLSDWFNQPMTGQIICWNENINY